MGSSKARGLSLECLGEVWSGCLSRRHGGHLPQAEASAGRRGRLSKVDSDVSWHHHFDTNLFPRMTIGDIIKNWRHIYG